MAETNQIKCQPSLSNPCLTTDQILSGGGKILNQIDGSVSVWVKNDEGLIPYTNINTKSCCEYLGYIFDVENQKCLWTEPISCDTCEMKIVINPNGNDGDYFLVGENSTCALDINLNYIFKFDCSILASAKTVNQEALLLESQLEILRDELADKELECASLSGQCVQYTNIYTAMCYTILVSKHISDYDELNNPAQQSGQNSNSTATSMPGPGKKPFFDIDISLPVIPQFFTVCCLTDAGLERWYTILGEVKYQAWLASNGCDTTIYTSTQSEQLYNEGNDYAIENNTFNPYFSETDAKICDKQQAYLEKEEKCKAYEDCLNEISELEKEISELETQLSLLADEGILCDDPIANLENFKAWFSLDVETETPKLYETVYEEEIFNIGEGNLMQYIQEQSPLTGIIISGDSGVLPPFGIESTCDYDNICKLNRDAFIRELYLRQYLTSNDAPTTTLENKELLELMGGWYNSSWLPYSTIINDPAIIEKIKNKKIRISIKVSTCCLDFGLLLDEIRVTQNCENIDNTFIKVTKPFGFELNKYVDNKKSWVSNESPERRTYYLDWRNTEYNINHHKLSINTKEIDLNIDPAKAIEGDVFKYFFNNPCGLDCSSGTTVVEFNPNVDLQLVLDDALNKCNDCVSCYQQKQFENYECFDLMNGEPYEFQFQEEQIINDCDTIVKWVFKVELDNVIVYNDNIFFTGNTETSIPTQILYLNELNNIANTLGLIFINNGTTASFVDVFGCDGIRLDNKNFKIDLNLIVETCEKKKFEDGDCFIFMDDDIFQFEDQ
jgi:hypothetical protein